MPLYEYECEHCGQRFEVIQKFSDAPPAACKKCGGGPVRKLLSSPAIQFKGSGFYLTDYGRGTTSKSESGNGKGEKGEKGEKSEKSEKADKSAGSASASGDSATKSESAPSKESKKSTSDTSSAKPPPAKTD